MTMREGEYLSALYVCCSEQTDRNLLAAMQETAGGGESCRVWSAGAVDRFELGYCLVRGCFNQSPISYCRSPTSPLS